MEYSCDECYEMRQPKTETCPECGRETFVGQVTGISMSWECKSCGWSCISAGGFAQACTGTEKTYSLDISKPAGKECMVRLAKVLAMNPLDMVKEFSSDSIAREYHAVECVEKYKSIKALGIECTVSARLLKEYSRILDCPYV